MHKEKKLKMNLDVIIWKGEDIREKLNVKKKMPIRSLGKSCFLKNIYLIFLCVCLKILIDFIYDSRIGKHFIL